MDEQGRITAAPSPGKATPQPYSTPKGLKWVSVEKKDIKPGEKFHEQPIYQKQRLNWAKYIGAHVENQVEAERQKLKLAGLSEDIDTTRQRLHRQLSQDFLNKIREEHAGERMGKSQIRAAQIRHIEGLMKGHRDYMAG